MKQDVENSDTETDTTGAQMTETGKTGPEPDAPDFDSKQQIKLAIEIGPLILFGLTYWKFGLLPATAVLMAGTIVALIISKLVLKQVNVMLIVTAVLVTLFGGLTLWLQDTTFIKMKPTMVYILFSLVLFGGLITGRNFLSLLFGQAFNLTDEGWFKLTVRWAVFFIFLAILNELVWRNFSESTWVNFKLFGFIPLTMIFAVSQMGLMKRYEPGDKT